MSNAGFTSAWHGEAKLRLRQPSAASPRYRRQCTLWQLVQLTPPLRVRRTLEVRMRFRMAAQAGLHPLPSRESALLICLILVTSPPLSTCALPDPWQLSQVAPWRHASGPACECGLLSNFLATSAWHVAQTSEPTKSAGSAAAAFLRHSSLLVPARRIPRLRYSRQQCDQSPYTIENASFKPSAECIRRHLSLCPLTASRSPNSCSSCTKIRTPNHPLHVTRVTGVRAHNRTPVKCGKHRRSVRATTRASICEDERTTPVCGIRLQPAIAAAASTRSDAGQSAGEFASTSGRAAASP